MSVTSINHSLTEPDFDSFRYHITSVAQVTGTTFLKIQLSCMRGYKSGHMIVFTKRYNLASQKGISLKLCNNVSKLRMERLLYGPSLSPLILLWNIISSVEV